MCDCMNRSFVLVRVCVLLLLVAGGGFTVEGAVRKPNILLIYSDDHGWADLGAQGVDRDIHTPNLDQLARDGVRFTRGYVSAPQCVPSRAGVLTGRYQQRFGVEDNNKGPLPLAERTIAERLKPAGYVSGQVGKWHLDVGGAKGGGKEARLLKDHLPHGQGFDEYWCGTLRQFQASHDLKGQPLAGAPRVVSDDRFRVVVQTEAALSFLDRRAMKPEQPWFLYLAWFAPHVPLDSPEPWFSRTPAHLPKERRQALAMIAAMDDGLGRIRARLREMGAEHDTLIVFIGDNGAPVKEGAWDGSLNLPLIGEKGMLTDGGVRVPFVAAWPGRIPAGQVYERPVINLDIAATAVALAGLPRENLDGVNLMSFLTGENQAAPHDALYWRWRSQAAVLEFPWKLIQLGTNENYLFNVTLPEGETKNLIAQNPDVAARLAGKLKIWSAGLKPPGAPEPNNDQDNLFFAAHVDKTAGLVTRRRAAGNPPVTSNDNLQGWLARNGTLAVRDGALTLTPDAAAANARLFFTRSGLDVPGPVTVTLRARARQGGAATVTWRTKAEGDFAPGNSATLDWPSSSEWREIKAELPVQGRLIHLRITPAKGSRGLEVQSIEVRGRDGEPQVWDFRKTP
jgi:arylsulfatase A-like enzyme/predicted NUDIX family NTP pyrophosphohydrolase